MADEKISQLTDGSSPQDTDEFPIARSGANYSLTWAELKSGITTGVSSVFGRSGAVAATSGDYTAAQVTNAADKSSGSQQNFTGEVKSPDFVAAGLTGATAASRYVGATASGAPGSGTFAVGDFIIDQSGKIWICTVAGSPGTWSQVSGGGGGSATKQVKIPLTAPDSAGNAYAAMVTGASTNIRELVPAFTHDVDGFWWGIVRVPQDYASTPKIILSIAANATSGVTTLIVATKVIANSASYDQALTAETAQDITVPATAYVRDDVTFTLSTTPAAGSDMLVYVEHNGTAVNDTLAVDTLLFNAVFQYST